jgi:hypothetical protein
MSGRPRALCAGQTDDRKTVLPEAGGTGYGHLRASGASQQARRAGVENPLKRGHIAHGFPLGTAGHRRRGPALLALRFVLFEKCFKKLLSSAKVRSAQSFERFGQIGHASARGAIENAQRPGYREAIVSRNCGASAIIHRIKSAFSLRPRAIAALSPASNMDNDGSSRTAPGVGICNQSGCESAYLLSDSGAEACRSSSQTSEGANTLSNSLGRRPIRSIWTK